MGNTCSSVHIALTGTTPEAINGIVRAYSGPLKVLTDKSRATQWSKVFGKPLSANDAFKIELREASGWRISNSRCCQSCRLKA